jgi:hypothetical protein
VDLVTLDLGGPVAQHPLRGIEQRLPIRSLPVRICLLHDCTRPIDPGSIAEVINPLLVVASIRSPLARLCCPPEE